MQLHSNQETQQLFQIAKYPCTSASVEFPVHGEGICIDLQNATERIKFQSDISRKFKVIEKLTLQLRHQKIYTIRRLDFCGNHKNPPGPAPDEIFVGYEDHLFYREDHVHFYMHGFNDRWALPLFKIPEIGIQTTDTMYEKMIKFFEYCNVQNLHAKVVPHLGV